MKKLLICTPIKNIEGLLQKLTLNFKVIYNPYLSNKSKINLKEFHYIFLNPNMSKIKLDIKTLKKFSNLRAVCTASTGTNHIDLEYLKRNNIKLFSLRNKINTIKKISSTSEHAFALMLNAIRNLNTSSESIKKKKLELYSIYWTSNKFFDNWYNWIRKVRKNICKTIKRF